MRNKFEHAARAAIPDRFGYENTTIAVAIEHSYLPDFFDPISNTIIEIKGWLRPDCMRKMRAVRSQYPALRMIIVFQKPATTISKRSKTTYAEWAMRHGMEVMTLDEVRDL